MTIRIVVLIVFTGLFAAAWSSDNDTDTKLVRQTPESIQRLPKTDEPSSADPKPTNDFAVNGPILRVPKNVMSTVEETTRVFAPVIRTVSQSGWITPETKSSNNSTEQPPTPPGIASGHYRVVTNDGVMSQLSVPGNNQQSVRDLYIYRTAERRWYYIRQESIGTVPQPKPEVNGPSVVISPVSAEKVAIADREAKRRLQVLTRWLIGQGQMEVATETTEETELAIPTVRTAEAPAKAERQ